MVKKNLKNFLIYLRIPKIQTIVLLILIASSAILFQKQFLSFWIIGLAVLTAAFADIALIKLRGLKPFFPSAAIVSGLIIGLLSAPTLPWYQLVLASAAAILSKNFLRSGKRHIFNPAALGLFSAALIFNNPISWWGASFQILSAKTVSVLLFLVLLSPGYVSMLRLRRERILLGFFAAHTLLTGNLRPLLDPTTLFFALVMLPEPMTSPALPLRQFLFGAAAAGGAYLTGFIPAGFIIDPLIAGLLIANLLFHSIPNS